MDDMPYHTEYCTRCSLIRNNYAQTFNGAAYSPDGELSRVESAPIKRKGLLSTNRAFAGRNCWLFRYPRFPRR